MEEQPEELGSAAQAREVDALQQEILNIEQTLNRELRIKNRKMQKFEAQLHEVKRFLRKLISEFVLTDDVIGEITNMQENLDEKMSDDSQMFLSSNWSMGGLSMPCQDTVIFDRKGISGIPALNMQVLADMVSHSSEAEDEAPNQQLDNPTTPALMNQIDQLLQNDMEEESSPGL